MEKWLTVAMIILCLPYATGEILYKTGWEFGDEGRTGVTDTGNPLGSLTEIGNIDQFGLGYVDSADCFEGDKCLRIDWEHHGDGSETGGACEWFVQTPNVMQGIHEYYIGFATKYPKNWENPIGRKLIYRVGGDGHSLLFSGTKGWDCGQDLDAANLWVKNKADTQDQDWSQSDGEKLYYGGPKCDTTWPQSCSPWPGTEEPILLESDNEWHTIILYVREHETDGAYTMWVDGVKTLHIDRDSWNAEYTDDVHGGPCEVNVYNNHEADFNAFKFPTYFNFGPPNHDQSEYWDNFIISTTLEEAEEYLYTGDADDKCPGEAIFCESFDSYPPGWMCKDSPSQYPYNELGPWNGITGDCGWTDGFGAHMRLGEGYQNNGLQCFKSDQVENGFNSEIDYWLYGENLTDEIYQRWYMKIPEDFDKDAYTCKLWRYITREYGYSQPPNIFVNFHGGGKLSDTDLSILVTTLGQEYQHYMKPFSDMNDGEWHSHELHLKLNSQGNDDGIVEYWFDGNLEYSSNSANFDIDADVPVAFHRFGVGMGNCWDDPWDMEEWTSIDFDEVVVSRDYIGPISGQCIHPADNSPCDGTISSLELFNYLLRWTGGTVSNNNLIRAMVLWKG